MIIDILYVGLATCGIAALIAALAVVKLKMKKRENIFMTDPLTGGVNREGFIKKANELLAERGYSSYTVCWLNVCNFKRINELWGEIEGNKTLKFIYNNLAHIASNTELYCRSSVDQFIFLIEETEEDKVQARLNTMLDNISQVVSSRINGARIDFGMGCCNLANTSSFSTALNNAIVMQKRQQIVNKCMFYNQNAKDDIETENLILFLFDESIANKDFKVYLQPKIPLNSSEPCHAEALVRWAHPTKGIISPGVFIPLIEENNKISQLDLYVFETVCQTIAKWIENGDMISPISVNLSRYHLRSSGIQVCDEYRLIKEKYNIPDGLIELELTETMMIDNNQFEFIKLVLAKFRSIGIRMALDDFGFGFSSLSQLKEFDVDTLKLDKSFFINENRKSKLIVSRIIDLAHDLKLNVVAEGIETKEQVQMLSDFNCDYIQGYYYSKPISIAEFEQWRTVYEK